MSARQRQPDPTAGRPVPYPSWPDIAADVGRAAEQGAAPASRHPGRSWHDLLAGDGPAAGETAGSGSAHPRTSGDDGASLP